MSTFIEMTYYFFSLPYTFYWITSCFSRRFQKVCGRE